MTITMKAPLEVGICVADLDRAVAFYQGVLGFARISEATLPPERAEAAGFGPVAFRMVRMQTNYGERIKLLETTPGPDQRAGFDPGTRRHQLSHIRGRRYRGGAGAPYAIRRQMMSAQPIQTRPGTRLIFFRDSEGNPLELVQYDDLSAYRPDICSKQ